MTQFQFDLICKLIENGAPALANELITALQGMVQTCNATAEENAQLKARIEELTADCKCSADCECEHGCKCSVEN
jgi:hypothetical protein